MNKSLLYLIAIAFILSSCGQKFSLQKRKYNKGFYFASSSKVNAQNKISEPSKKVTEVKPEPVEIVTVEPTIDEEPALTNAEPGTNYTVYNHKTSSYDSPAIHESSSKNPVLNKFEVQKKATKHSAISNKRDGGDFFYNLYIGLYIISGIVGIVVTLILIAPLFTTTQMVLIVIGIIVFFALCAGVGSMVSGF